MNEKDFNSALQSALQGMSPSTQAIYSNLWNRWRNWCKARRIEPFPVTQDTLDLFVAEMSSQRRSAQYIRHFLSVLRLANRLVGYDDDLTMSTRELRFRPPYVLLNSAAMPASGTYFLREFSQKDWVKAIQIAANEDSIQSYIGYPDTAKHVQEITGLPIEVNRSEVTLGKAATLFIVKLKYRIADPTQKGQFVPSETDYVYYIAQYVS
jgi:hypothetical protein